MDATTQRVEAGGASPRRRFLTGTAAVAAGGAAVVAMPNVSRADTVVLKMQGAWGAKDIFNDMAVQYVNRVNEMAGGRLKIEYLIAGAVVKPFSLQDAVNDGVLDMGHHVTAYWYGKNKAASLFGTSPVRGWNAHQGLAWIHQGGGQALYGELVQQILGMDIIGFCAMPMPTQPLGWLKKKPESADDLRGLKYRTVASPPT
jgi:TRAP-type mannitol/chloroaromatic compound transport system substrate-binding protein